MQVIQETFLETDWEDEQAARAARDARAEQLQVQGLLCRREDLYNVRGDRVFLLEATPVEPLTPTRVISTSTSERPSAPRQVKRKILEYERR